MTPEYFPATIAFRKNPARGLTLVEVMITLAIFVILAGFMLLAVRETIASWTSGERRRVLYERASGVLDIMSDDLRLALTQEPSGVTEVKVRFIGDFEPNTKNQRLMFVRTFEAGPERALTGGSGISPTPPATDDDDPSKPKPAPVTLAKGGGEYTGLSVEKFKALGGMAMAGYFVKDHVLYRTIHAPVPPAMSKMLTPENSQILASDVLYFSLDYWGQLTKTWERQAPHAKLHGPEIIWDSTRGISAAPLDKFYLHRSAISLNDPEDDVFPKKVRITLTVDSPMPRCVFTKLIAPIGETDGEIEVDSTKGFSDGDDENGFILIEDEWIQYKKKTADHFKVEKRGVRGTIAKGHPGDAIVRAGRTFHRIVYLPNWREDFTPDDVYRARKQHEGPRRVVDDARPNP